jgi:hypothetical protein
LSRSSFLMRRLLTLDSAHLIIKELGLLWRM